MQWGTVIFRFSQGAVTHTKAGRDAGFSGPLEFTWTAPAEPEGHLEFWCVT